MKIIIIVLSFVILPVDWFIYRQVIVKVTQKKLLRRLYIVLSLLLDLTGLISLGVSAALGDEISPVVSRAVIWGFYLFYLNTTPKGIFFLSLLVDRLTGAIARKRVVVFRVAGLALALMVMATMLWGAMFGRSKIEVKRVELTFDNLPASFDGFRVVQFSDTHIGNLISAEMILSQMVDSINVNRPDLVVNSGDLVNVSPYELTDDVTAILMRIKSRHGVYSVLGNHDIGIYIADPGKHSASEYVAELIRRQEAMGWHVLVSQSVYLVNGEDSISLSGVGFPSDFQKYRHSTNLTGVDLGATYDSIPPGMFNFTITHAPQLWNDILKVGNSDVTVAGHVHAMQLKIRLLRWIWSPAMLIYNEWSGLYERDGKYLYINDGIGYGLFPMRIGTYPEVTIITLRSTQK